MPKKEITDPIERLANDYAEDLKILRDMDFYIITKIDKMRLEVMCGKYGLDAKVDTDNFILTISKLNKIILDRFEKLGIDYILERVREQDGSKVPRAKTVEKEETNPDDSWG